VQYTTGGQLGVEAQQCLLVLGFQDDGVRVVWEFGGQPRTFAGSVGTLGQRGAKGQVAPEDDVVVQGAGVKAGAGWRSSWSLDYFILGASNIARHRHFHMPAWVFHTGYW